VTQQNLVSQKLTILSNHSLDSYIFSTTSSVWLFFNIFIVFNYVI